MVSRDEIAWAYRLLFDREPESEEAYAAHSVHADVATLRRVLIGSHEGQYRLSQALRETMPPLHFDYYRPLLILLHIEKTGGTSLYDMLARTFPPGRVSEPHLSRIPTYSLAELNQFDFISGHFPWGEAMALPRSGKSCIALFREPAARLISFYRFLRAHPASAGETSELTRLAQQLDPIAFFRDARVRGHPRMFNNYVHILAGLPRNPSDWTGAPMAAACALAEKRVGELASIGLTEDMAGSTRLIFDLIGQPPPDEIRRSHVTDQIHRNMPEFRPVAPVVPSPALTEVIAPLIEHDRRIYARACRRFAADLARLDRSTGVGAIA